MLNKTQALYLIYRPITYFTSKQVKPHYICIFSTNSLLFAVRIMSQNISFYCVHHREPTLKIQHFLQKLISAKPGKIFSSFVVVSKKPATELYPQPVSSHINFNIILQRVLRGLSRRSFPTTPDFINIYFAY